MHYGTFRLGREPMEEPVKRLCSEATRLGIANRVRVLDEGETLRLGNSYLHQPAAPLGAAPIRAIIPDRPA
jgi:hypothetical protein